MKIANFRRVTFSVDLSLPDERKFMGDSLSASFGGRYLAGGNVSNGKWSWFWTRREQWYEPPGDALANYTFGAVTREYPEDLGSASGSLSGDGLVTAKQALADGDKGRVYDYEVSATVEDIDRQAISKSDSRLVFSSQQLLGALISSSPQADDSLYFVQKDTPFTLKVVSVDPDGKPYPSGEVKGRLLPRGLEASPRTGSWGHDRHPLRERGSAGTRLQREAGQAFRERPALHAEVRLVHHRAFRPRRKGPGELHARFLLFYRQRFHPLEQL